MADSLKEIYNGNITVSNLAATGSFTLLTTDANTQYVIKDLETNGSNFGTSPVPVLTINGFAVANLLSNSTGSEIVDINSTVVAKVFSAAPTLTKNIMRYVTAGSLYSKTYSLVNTAPVAASTDVFTNLGVAANLTTQSANISVSTNGSFYYTNMDGNSTCQLYKRAGGPAGTETLISNTSYSWCVFDGINSYYYSGGDGSSTLYKYNIDTQTTTTVNCGAVLSQSSYPAAYYMNNGMIVYCRSSNNYGSAFNILNPATGSVTVISSGISTVSWTNQNYKLSGYYDSSTGRYTIYRRFNTTLYKCQMNGTLTIGSAYSGGVTETTYTLANLGNAFNSYVTQDATNYSWGVHGVTEKTQLTTYNTITATTTVTDWVPVSTTANQIFISAPVAADAADFTTTLGLRLTGVKSTI